MITEKEIAIAQEYLADKTIEGVWVNEAGELFFSKELALASDKDAEFIKKTAKKKEQQTGTPGADSHVAEAKSAALKEEKLKLLAETTLVKENYQAMKGLVKFFEIKTENNSADTLITALTAFKETLKNL
ncbi:MAG: hypothetical protein ABIP27_16640 [Flavobacterium circumlabens]|uniref:hypothetical protein n=1 Tax=Flavobacterium circumlabens TaxID=2133765 RepID=UPI003265B0AC